jgi:hypothetical protein
MVVSGDKKPAQDYIEGLNMLSNMRLCSNVPGQWAIQTALGGYQSINDLICEGGRLRRQRDLAYELITAIPGVTCVKPTAALYMFPRLDPEDVPDRGRPAVLPGAAAGNPCDAGAGHGLQLAGTGSFPHRVPAARGRPARGDWPRGEIPGAVPQTSRNLNCFIFIALNDAIGAGISFFNQLIAMKPIQVGLLGIGTVGSGTFNVLKRNQQEIQRRAGRGIEITMVADLDVARARSIVGPDVRW